MISMKRRSSTLILNLWLKPMMATAKVVSNEVVVSKRGGQRFDGF